MDTMVRNRKTAFFITALLMFSLGSACTSKTSSQGTTLAPENPLNDKGIGPVSDLKLASNIDGTLAMKGKQTFEAKCSMCHKIQERFVGPALHGVTQRRAPEWIMNMALNPAEMTQKDPIAKDLLAQYMTQMSFQNVTQDDVRSILEFFRQNDQKP